MPCLTFLIDSLALTDITGVELHFIEDFRALRLKVVAHIVLLLLITAKDANHLNVAVQEAPKDGVSEGSRASGDE